MRVLLQALLTTLLVSASAYTPHVADGGPIAADGSNVIPHCTIAVSHDLKHLLGRRVHIEGVGWRRVNDLMHRRWRQAIDVCVGGRSEAREFGRQRVTMRVER